MFSQPTVQFGWFYKVDTTYGSEYVPCDDVHPVLNVPGLRLPGDTIHNRPETPLDYSSPVWGALVPFLTVFYPEEVHSVSIRRGYGARFTNKGWQLFDTRDEACDYLDEMMVCEVN